MATLTSVLSNNNLEFKTDGSTAVKMTGSLVIDDDDNSIPTLQLTANTQVQNVLAPVLDTDAANKAYVDGVAQGLHVKDSVRAATTANGTLTSAFANGQTVDGVTLATGDRILVKNQTTGSENGIYTVNASGAPTRANDFDSDADVSAGAFTFVEEGTVNADAGFVMTNDGTITIGSTALTFAQFSGAGQITGGTNITKSGNTLNFDGGKNDVEITRNTASTSTSSGALQVTGGVGIGGSVYAGGTSTAPRAPPWAT